MPRSAPLLRFVSQRFCLEGAVHSCPSLLLRDLRNVFPERATQGGLDGVTVIPTFQRTACHLTNFSVETEAEKDRLARNFFQWSDEVIRRLETAGFWGDVTDPATGVPIRSVRGAICYNDLDGAELLGEITSVMAAGSCQIALHPRWGERFYVATLFAVVPTEKLKIVLEATDAAPRTEAQTI